MILLSINTFKYVDEYMCQKTRSLFFQLMDWRPDSLFNIFLGWQLCNFESFASLPFWGYSLVFDGFQSQRASNAAPVSLYHFDAEARQTRSLSCLVTHLPRWCIITFCSEDKFVIVWERTSTLCILSSSPNQLKCIYIFTYLLTHWPLVKQFIVMELKQRVKRCVCNTVPSNYHQTYVNMSSIIPCVFRLTAFAYPETLQIWSRNQHIYHY